MNRSSYKPLIERANLGQVLSNKLAYEALCIVRSGFTITHLMPEPDIFVIDVLIKTDSSLRIYTAILVESCGGSNTDRIDITTKLITFSNMHIRMAGLYTRIHESKNNLWLKQIHLGGFI